MFLSHQILKCKTQQANPNDDIIHLVACLYCSKFPSPRNSAELLLSWSQQQETSLVDLGCLKHSTPRVASTGANALT